MKRLFVLILALFLFVSPALIFADDTIAFLDGSKIVVKVKQVSPKGALVEYEGTELLFAWDTMPVGEALRVWETNLNPKNANDWYSIGMFARECGLKDRARSYFEQAVRLDPSLSEKIPSLINPDAEAREIKKLLDDAKKAEIAKNHELALAILQRVYDWPSRDVLDNALRDTDYIDRVLLLNQIRLLEKAIFEKRGFTRMGRKWVTDDERKRREKDIMSRDESRRLDDKEDARHATWDNAWERSGEMFRIRSNVSKWYLLRFKDRLDVLFTNLKGILSITDPPANKIQVNIYNSRDLYVQQASTIKPGTSNLGGFYAENTVHMFLESDQEDLTFEDLAIMSLEYLATQAFLYAYFKKVPFWFESGFALYVQDSKWTAPLSVEIGTSPNRYALTSFLASLDAGAFFDPARLASLEGSGSSFDKNASWAVVAYFMQGASSAVKTSLIRAVKGLDAGDTPLNNLVAKDDKLKDEVVKYVRKLQKPLIALQVPPYPMF